MKKNVMMRLACFLLVAVLISTSAISGTYAKYTTQDAGKDEARVAKWGVELQVIGNLYGDSYGTDDKIVLDTDSSVTVQTLNTAKDVVAPGTKNDEGFTFSLKGQPEVDGIVTTTMKIQNIFLAKGTYGIMIPVKTGVVTAANFEEFAEDLYVKNSSDEFEKATAYAAELYTLEDLVEMEGDEKYYPVVYKLDGNTEMTSGDIGDDSLKLAADEIAAQLGLTAGGAAGDTSITYTGNKTFATNTDLASWKIVGESLTWAWAFGDPDKDGDVGPATTDAAWTDGADTILGLLKNTTDGTVVKLDGSVYVEPDEYDDYCLDTQFSIDITVTQVD